MVILQLVNLDGIPIAAVSVGLWPVAILCFIRGFRFTVIGSHQAAEVVAISSKVAVPMRSIDQFDRWLKESKYSRFSHGAMTTKV